MSETPWSNSPYFPDWVVDSLSRWFNSWSPDNCEVCSSLPNYRFRLIFEFVHRLKKLVSRSRRKNLGNWKSPKTERGARIKRKSERSAHVLWNVWPCWSDSRFLTEMIVILENCDFDIFRVTRKYRNLGTSNARVQAINLKTLMTVRRGNLIGYIGNVLRKTS